MNVQELVELLRQCPSDLDVVVASPRTGEVVDLEEEMLVDEGDMLVIELPEA